MPRIAPVAPEAATGSTKSMLDGVRKSLGRVPNLMATLGRSPAALEAYLGFSAALGKGTFSARQREQIALTVAQANSCDYCLSAHSAIGKLVGLSPAELAQSREGRDQDARIQAGLRFAQEVVEARGRVSDEQLARVRQAGYSDGEITELVANVVLNIFTNYFNHVADTEVDFPRVDARQAA